METKLSSGFFKGLIKSDSNPTYEVWKLPEKPLGSSVVYYSNPTYEVWKPA